MNAKTIALSAIIAALCAILLAVGEFFPTFSLGSAFLAGVAVMVPLAKRSYWGAVLCVIAASLITMLVTGFSRFEAVVPFAFFFGVQPIVNRVQAEKNWNRWLLLVIKDIWFVGFAVGYYFLFNLTLFENNQDLNRFALPIIIIGGAIAYVVYDYLSFYFQRYIDILIKRMKL